MAPIRSSGLNILGENYSGYNSSWEDFNLPIIQQVYEREIHWHQLIMQQFVVTRKGDILYNHPDDGIIKLDIDTGLTQILLPKRADSGSGANGNGDRWHMAKVDNVAKMTMDERNNIIFIDNDKIRRFDYNDPSASMLVYKSLDSVNVNQPFERVRNYSPFYFSQKERLYHLSPIMLESQTSNFSLNYESDNHNGEKTDFEFSFNDFKEKVSTDYGGVIKEEVVNLSSNSCGDFGDRIEVDISDCSIINYFSTPRDQQGYRNLIFAADCECKSNLPDRTIGLFHVQPFYDLDNDLLDYQSRIEEAVSFARGLADELVRDGQFFYGLDGALYLINRGQDVPFSSELNVEMLSGGNGGIWKFSNVSGWTRLLGMEDKAGICPDGTKRIIMFIYS